MTAGSQTLLQKRVGYAERSRQLRRDSLSEPAKATNCPA
jgi:hypothetical protein